MSGDQAQILIVFAGPYDREKVGHLLAGLRRGVALEGNTVWLGRDQAAIHGALILLAQKCHPMPQYVTFPLGTPGFGNLGRDLWRLLSDAGIKVEPPEVDL